MFFPEFFKVGIRVHSTHDSNTWGYSNRCVSSGAIREYVRFLERLSISFASNRQLVLNPKTQFSFGEWQNNVIDEPKLRIRLEFAFLCWKNWNFCRKP